MNGINPIESYQENVREFCMALHFYSPRAYQYVRERFNNNIPHVGTIRAWYANCNVDGQPGITQQCLDVIRERSEEKMQKKQQLVVAISFDEILPLT